MRPILFLVLSIALAQAQPDGSALYAKHCARCHEVDQSGWAPRRQVLAKQPPEAILGQLHLGFMSLVATLTDDEKRALASYITGKPAPEFRMPPAPKPEGLCAPGSSTTPDLLMGPRWNGWGIDLDNSRFQTAAMAQLNAADIPRLKLKWAFAFPLAPAAWSQPVVAGGRVFAGSMNGAIYSLDANTGCTHWSYMASPAGVRAAITIGPGVAGSRFTAYAGDITATVHAIDALNGTLLWKTKIDDHPLARVTGAPQLHDGRLYVPLASMEEAAAANPKYECCTFRGSVVAIDAATGEPIWKTHLIDSKPRPTQKNVNGTQQWGPSGAAVWSAPTIDLQGGLLYVSTGDYYSDPEEGWGVSIVAIEMNTGKIAWAKKALTGDRWNVACISGDKVNCPKREGPDFDFGSSPILRRLANGKQVLLAGQKSGDLHFLDPDQRGAIIRTVKAGKGGILGGIEWGPAADAGRVYVAISGHDWKKPAAGGGLSAFQIATGERLWHTPAPKPACLANPPCSAAQPAAVTAIPGAVFSGSLDGHLRAYSSADGRILWDFDTRKAYDTVNRYPGQGGSLNGPGVTVAGGVVFANSGYGFLGGSAGNVLLAFTVDGK
jgi:polyvinyl alcohol dehydrogenase (cytochrome)